MIKHTAHQASPGTLQRCPHNDDAPFDRTDADLEDLSEPFGGAGLPGWIWDEVRRELGEARETRVASRPENASAATALPATLKLWRTAPLQDSSVIDRSREAGRR